MLIDSYFIQFITIRYYWSNCPRLARVGSGKLAPVSFGCISMILWAISFFLAPKKIFQILLSLTQHWNRLFLQGEISLLDMFITTGVLPFLKDDMYTDTSAFNSALLGSLTPSPVAYFLFKTIYLFIYYWLSLACPCCTGFSLVAASGGYSPVAVSGLLVAGTSLVPEYKLQSVPAQWLWHTGLVALRCVGSSRIRDWTHVSCIGRWTLNHWTTREVPPSFAYFQHSSPRRTNLASMILIFSRSLEYKKPSYFKRSCASVCLLSWSVTSDSFPTHGL